MQHAKKTKALVLLLAIALMAPLGFHAAAAADPDMGAAAASPDTGVGEAADPDMGAAAASLDTGAGAAETGAASLDAGSAAGQIFTDVGQSHWAHGAVAAMSQKGVVAGYPDGSFKPGETVTYGEFIKMAVVAGTGKDPGNQSGAGAHWAEGYYQAGLDAGYYHIHNIPIYQLPWEIPRGDMALIAAAILGNESPVSDYDAIAAQITDVSHRTQHEYAIIRAYSAGILTGYPDDTFRPDGTLTRAESATVMDRLIGKIGPQGGGAEAAGSAAGAQPTATLARMQSGDPNDPTGYSELKNWSSTSTSQRPITEVLVSYQSGDQELVPSGEYWDFYFERTPYYEIVEDYPHAITLERNPLGTEVLRKDGPMVSHMAALIKDKKATDLYNMHGEIRMIGAEPGSDFPKDFDYLAFWHIGGGVMMLIPNPLR